MRAIEAGADMALICHNQASMKTVYNSLLRAYKDGTLKQEQVDGCVEKILRAKLRNIGREGIAKFPACF